MAVPVAITTAPAAHADENDDAFLLALFRHGIRPTGDPAGLVYWAHWTCDQLNQGAKDDMFWHGWATTASSPIPGCSAIPPMCSSTRQLTITARRTRTGSAGSADGTRISWCEPGSATEVLGFGPCPWTAQRSPRAVFALRRESRFSSILSVPTGSGAIPRADSDSATPAALDGLPRCAHRRVADGSGAPRSRNPRLVPGLGWSRRGRPVGRVSVHHEMKRSQQIIGLGGAVVGIGVGLWDATRRPHESAAAPTTR